MSKRGGSRPGAGRKAILDDWERISVGIKCEHVLNRIAKARQDQQFADDLDETALPDFWRWVNSIPVSRRKEWRKTQEAKDHSASVAEERAALKITGVNGRYGVRKRVIREVTDWARRQFGIELKKSYIEDCWEEYRAFLASD